MEEKREGVGALSRVARAAHVRGAPDAVRPRGLGRAARPSKEGKEAEGREGQGRSGRKEKRPGKEREAK